MAYFVGVEIRHEMEFEVLKRLKNEAIRKKKGSVWVPEHKRYKNSKWFVGKTRIHRRMSGSEFVRIFACFGEREMKFKEFKNLFQFAQRDLAANEGNIEMYNEKMDLLSCAEQLIDDFANDIYLNNWFPSKSTSISAIDFVRDAIKLQIQKQYDDKLKYNLDYVDEIIKMYVGAESASQNSQAASQTYFFMSDFIELFEAEDADFDCENPLTDRISHTQRVSIWIGLLTIIDSKRFDRHFQRSNLYLQHLRLFVRVILSFLCSLSTSFHLERNVSHMIFFNTRKYFFLLVDDEWLYDETNKDSLVN